MNTISDYLRVQLREKLKGKDKHWIVDHSAVGTFTKLTNQKRMDKGEIKLYITTSVMLCGIDLPQVDIILVTRPFSHMSSIIQAGGRGGRMQKDEARKRVVVYLLYNATDIRSNARHISNGVRNLYRDNGCFKDALKHYFSPSEDVIPVDINWCFNIHS